MNSEFEERVIKALDKVAWLLNFGGVSGEFKESLLHYYKVLSSDTATSDEKRVCMIMIEDIRNDAFGYVDDSVSAWKKPSGNTYGK